jgi:2-polyprenyl-3-methyl-5-hydroxy-6-metoxy-1,4-benzoquinol methylase
MKPESRFGKNGEYYNREREDVIECLAGAHGKILEIGCANGFLGRRLRELGRVDEIVGVELFASAAEEAMPFYDKIVIGDIETLSLNYKWHFDYIVFADVLEHLRDPWRILEKSHEWLNGDGEIVLSLPNIRYWRVLRDLILKGEWEYQDAGILDITHLRFFTRKAAVKILRDAGFVDVRYRMKIGGPKQAFFNKLTSRLFEEFLASQIITLAGKIKSDDT